MLKKISTNLRKEMSASLITMTTIYVLFELISITESNTPSPTGYPYNEAFTCYDTVYH